MCIVSCSLPWPQLVTKRKCVVQLPKKVTVANILSEFLSTKKQRSSSDKIFVEIVEGESGFGRAPGFCRGRHALVWWWPTSRAGIRLYFDKALGTYLLYRFERPQYEKLYGGWRAPVRCRSRGTAHLACLCGFLATRVSRDV